MNDEDKKRLLSLAEDHVLALTVFGEGRGESIEGKVAIANVIMNRLCDKRWPKTIASVCLQPLQFSCWNDEDPNSKVLLRKSKQGTGYDTDIAWKECLFAARGVINRYVRDNTKGANHYHTKAIKPSWAAKMERTAEIGNHLFYRG